MIVLSIALYVLGAGAMWMSVDLLDSIDGGRDAAQTFWACVFWPAMVVVAVAGAIYEKLKGDR